MTPRVLARARLGLRLGLTLVVLASTPSACSPEPAEPRAVAPPQGEAGARGDDDVPLSKPAKGRTRRSPGGLGCAVKNDCAPSFSCIRGVCQPASFGLSPTGKECVQIDCTASGDCCKGLATEVPEKCRPRAALCLAELPGCEQKPCTRSRDCAGGGVCRGRCSVTSGECSGNVDCLANKCVGGQCTLDFTNCTADAECAANNCAGGSCGCENPSYTPSHPLCSDAECDSLCLWTCEGSRCVLPSDCRTSDDCYGSKPVCVDGTCTECAQSVDCSFDKICLAGSCETPCRQDSQCGLFEACQAGECIYVGCRSDRECALLPELSAVGLPSSLDARLLRCHTERGVGRCLIPCQTDSQCATTEVCSGGLCQYIGCTDSAECKTIVALHGQLASDAHPWLASVECRSVEDSP
jgi:hypothetical protein